MRRDRLRVVRSENVVDHNFDAPVASRFAMNCIISDRAHHFRGATLGRVYPWDDILLFEKQGYETNDR